VIAPAAAPSRAWIYSTPHADDYTQVSLDWSVARSIWDQNGTHNATIEAVSREGCRLLKANHSTTKCFIVRLRA
jgi:hypothetical protein